MDNFYPIAPSLVFFFYENLFAFDSKLYVQFQLIYFGMVSSIHVHVVRKVFESCPIPNLHDQLKKKIMKIFLRKKRLFEIVFFDKLRHKLYLFFILTFKTSKPVLKLKKRGLLSHDPSDLLQW